jgi:ATP-dependent DNA helicase DinG
MIEAPTGVGKSLAYLIPALCWAKASGNRVVVSTHTIALQEQLFNKEIELLKEALPFSFNCALLKGRGNYLCMNRWRQVMDQGRNLIWGERVLLARLAVWLSEGARGDLDSIHLLGPEREWFSQMASSGDTCQANQCPNYKSCFYQKARATANASQLVIVNHALLLSGARIGESVVPKYSYLIVDEAHHLEEEGTRRFADSFSLLAFETKLQQLHRRRDVFGRPGFLQYLKEYQQQGDFALDALKPDLDQMEKLVAGVLKRVNSLQASLQAGSLPETFRIKPGKPKGERLQGLFAELDNLLFAAGDLKKTLDRLSVALQGDEGERFEETWLRLQLRLFEEVSAETGLLQAFLWGEIGRASCRERVSVRV